MFASKIGVLGYVNQTNGQPVAGANLVFFGHRDTARVVTNNFGEYKAEVNCIGQNIRFNCYKAGYKTSEGLINYNSFGYVSKTIILDIDCKDIITFVVKSEGEVVKDCVVKVQSVEIGVTDEYGVVTYCRNGEIKNVSVFVSHPGLESPTQILLSSNLDESTEFVTLTIPALRTDPSFLIKNLNRDFQAQADKLKSLFSKKNPTLIEHEFAHLSSLFNRINEILSSTNSLSLKPFKELYSDTGFCKVLYNQYTIWVQKIRYGNADGIINLRRRIINYRDELESDDHIADLLSTYNTLMNLWDSLLLIELETYRITKDFDNVFGPSIKRDINNALKDLEFFKLQLEALLNENEIDMNMYNRYNSIITNLKGRFNKYNTKGYDFEK